MNAWQLSKQFKYLVRLRTWPDAGGGLIWGNRVAVTNGMPKVQYAYMGSPAVLIAVNDDETDPQNPGYVRQIFTFTYWCAVPGDPRGENALIGGNRTAGNLSSSGRGILEYAEEISRLIKQLQETTGIKIIGRRKSDIGTGMIEKLGYVAMRQSVFEAKCTDQRYYHPPLRLQLSSGGVGLATLNWADPPTRFDQFPNPFTPTPGTALPVRIRRIAGRTPPSDQTQGIQVADVARGVQTFADAPGAGTWSYSLFASYTDSGVNQQERYNDGPSVEDGIAGTITV